jgi:hypothetical protein
MKQSRDVRDPDGIAPDDEDVGLVCRLGWNHRAHGALFNSPSSSNKSYPVGAGDACTRELLRRSHQIGKHELSGFIAD